MGSAAGGEGKTAARMRTEIGDDADRPASHAVPCRLTPRPLAVLGVAVAAAVPVLEDEGVPVCDALRDLVAAGV